MLHSSSTLRLGKLAVLVVGMLTNPLSLSAEGEKIVWRNLGPGGGGAFNFAAVSPANPDIVMFGSDVGGLYRSEDGGETWQLKNDAIVDPRARAQAYGVSGIAFAPSSPNIVYVGAGGVIKSIDSGRSWQVKNLDLNLAATTVDPSNADLVYAGDIRGKVYRSTNGWETGFETICLPAISPPDDRNCSTLNAIRPSIRALAVNSAPGSNNQVLACTNSGLYRSDDSGLFWTKLAPSGLPVDASGQPHEECNHIIVHPGTGILTMTLATHKGTADAKGWVDIDSWRGGAFRSSGVPWGESWSEVRGPEGNNLVSNPGFETSGDADHPAASWDYLGRDGVSLDSQVKHSGSYALKIQPTTRCDGGVRSAFLSVRGGSLHRVSAWAKVTNGKNITLFGRLRWFDAQQAPLNWPKRPSTWNLYSWRNVWILTEQKHGDFDWRRLEQLVRAPEQAAFARLDLFVTVPSGSTCITGGETWVDDVLVVETHDLPRITGQGEAPLFANYSHVAVDSENPGTAYVGITRGTYLDIFDAADTGGIWKFTGAAGKWEHVTRINYRDNVLDERASDPICGNGVCEGRWEDCNSCQEDCSGANLPVAPGCCGDNFCDSANGESQDNCLADCPFQPDPNFARPYYEVGGGGYEIWALATGSGALGHERVYFGSNSQYRSLDGGATWKEVNSIPVAPDLPNQFWSWSARGQTNYIGVYPIATDTHDPLRLYYGDADQFLIISLDGGESFLNEGRFSWSRLLNISGDAATSIVVDPNLPNRIYCGIYVNDTNNSGYPSAGGAVQGDFDPETRRWTWNSLGDQNTFPKGGGVDLFLHPGGTFYAAVYGKGVYRLENGVWVSGGQTWEPAAPVGWKTYRLAYEPISNRLYVSAGDPYHTSTARPQNGETGIWASDDGGMLWRRISDPGTDTGSGMDQEPVVAMLPLGPTRLLAGTWYAYGSASTVPQGCTQDCKWTGDGGIYEGVCAPLDASGQCVPDASWSWTKRLAQPNVTGLAASPRDSSVVYAYVAQVTTTPALKGQYAAIYKSLDSGQSWFSLPNDPTDGGLMNLRHGQLIFSVHDPLTLYTGTFGSGLFEGTIACGDPREGFPDLDGDGRANCSDEDDDADGDPDASDCEPLDAAVHHGASEICNGRDDNCVGGVDEGHDLDGDGIANCLDADADADGFNKTAGTPVTAVFSSEMPVIGTVGKSGNCPSTFPYQCTAGDDGQFETVKEKKVSGVSRLEHRWTLTAPAGGVKKLLSDTWRTNSTDGDSFLIAYSTDGTTFADVATVSRIAESAVEEFALPSAASGTVIVRALDSNRVSGGSLDTLSVDYLVIRTEYPADCDDLDARVNPGRTEGPTGDATCSDTLDNDCDGNPDGADAACQQAPQPLIHVESITLVCRSSVQGQRIKHYAQATVLIRDQSGQGVGGATVSGHWSGATSDSDVGATGAGGTVVLSSNLTSNGGTFTFTVVSVAAPAGSVYDPSADKLTSASRTCP